MPHLQPILAVDVGTVFTAVFLIVMFLGWVMQAVQGQNQPPQRRGGRGAGRGAGGGGGDRGGRGGRQGGRGPRQRPRDERIRTEIDAFLDEVEDRPDSEPVIEIVEPPKPRRERPRPERQRPERQRPRGERPRPERERPQPERERPQPEQRELGGGIRSHVDDFMAPHLSAGAQEHLPHLEIHVDDNDVVEPVRAPAQTAARGPHPIVAKLRDPRAVRDAIVMQMVLSPPPSLSDR